jgi:hypothetical protein
MNLRLQTSVTHNFAVIINDAMDFIAVTEGKHSTKTEFLVMQT